MSKAAHIAGGDNSSTDFLSNSIIRRILNGVYPMLCLVKSGIGLAGLPLTCLPADIMPDVIVDSKVTGWRYSRWRESKGTGWRYSRLRDSRGMGWRLQKQTNYITFNAR